MRPSGAQFMDYNMNYLSQSSKNLQLAVFKKKKFAVLKLAVLKE